VSSETGPNGARRRQKRTGLVVVARALGVSPSTVSNAYNRPDQLSPALRDRVLATAAELGYPGPDPVARSLRRGRAGTVGVVFHDRLAHAFDDPAAVQFLQGLSDATDAVGLAVVLVPGLPDTSAKVAAVRNAAVDGLILHGLLADDEVLAATVERRRPTVVVDTPVVEGLDFVGIDDAGAAGTAIHHLLDLGHRRLALLSFGLSPASRGALDPGDLESAGDSVARRRLSGCAAVFAEAGLTWSDVPVEQCERSSVEAGRAGAHALLDRADGATALFAFSDPLAAGARRAAAERGLAVPGDMSIVGFDGTAADEGITSVHQPQRDKGRIAAERLIGALGPDAAPPRRELLPTRLVLGATTAPPRGMS
jgi:DNA-binding LacI/PurR family transcriptional regulator